MSDIADADVRWRDLLKRRGYQNVRAVRLQAQHGTYRVEFLGADRFLKIADGTASPQEQLVTEFQAGAVLTRVVDGIKELRVTDHSILVDRVVKPHCKDPRMRVQRQYTILECPWIGDAVACDAPHEPPLSNKELGQLAELVAALHTIPEEDIPPFFISHAHEEFTDTSYLSCLLAHCGRAVVNGVLTISDTQALIAAFRSFFPLQRAFAHHDIVPANLMRAVWNHEDHDLVLVDAEYARYDMAGWDPAHFLFKTAFSGDAALGRRGFTAMFNAIREVRPSIAEEIFAPLLYGLAATAAGLEGTPIQIALVRGLLQKFLEKNLTVLTTPV